MKYTGIEVERTKEKVEVHLLAAEKKTPVITIHDPNLVNLPWEAADSFSKLVEIIYEHYKGLHRKRHTRPIQWPW